MAYRNSIGRNRSLLHTDVLNFFTTELLLAQAGGNYSLWIIAPWIMDVRLDLDGRSPLWEVFPGQEHFTLSQVVRRIVEYGGHVYVAAMHPGRPRDELDGPTARTYEVLLTLQKISWEQVHIHLFSDLHSKLYVGQAGGLQGSPNFTYQGLFGNKETVRTVWEPGELQELQEQCRQHFFSRENRISLPEFPRWGENSV